MPEPEMPAESYDLIRVTDGDTGEPLAGEFMVRSGEPYEVDESLFPGKKVVVERVPDGSDAPPGPAPAPDPGPEAAEPATEQTDAPIPQRVLTHVHFKPAWLAVQSVLTGNLRGVQFTVVSEGMPSVGSLVPDSTTLAMIAEMCLGAMSPSEAHENVVRAYELLRSARTGDAADA